MDGVIYSFVKYVDEWGLYLIMIEICNDLIDSDEKVVDMVVYLLIILKIVLEQLYVLLEVGQ